MTIGSRTHFCPLVQAGWARWLQLQLRQCASVAEEINFSAAAGLQGPTQRFSASADVCVALARTLVAFCAGAGNTAGAGDWNLRFPVLAEFSATEKVDP